LPSFDMAGRYFPLTFAALRDTAFAAPGSDAWLDICEAAGRDALEQDTPPQAIAERLGAPEFAGTANSADGVWWSDGSPRVRAGRMILHRMPDAAIYSAMLGVGPSGTDETSDDSGEEASGETTWKCTS
jgi:type VI secretion system protein ImpM